MTAPSTIDVGRLDIMLGELRLPSMKAIWADFAARADKEGWPAARFTRNGYDLRSLVDQFDAKPGEVRRLLRGSSMPLGPSNSWTRCAPPGCRPDPSHAFCVGPDDLASVSPIVRSVSRNVRPSPSPVSANVRRK